MNSAYIVDAVRIPRASVEKNTYAELTPVDLLKPLYRALESRNDLDSANVEDVILGCSTQFGGQGANIAKISALYAGWSENVSGATLNRFCCSGLDAINLSASKIMSGMESLTVAGGVEQMTQVPMFSDKGAWFSDMKVMSKTRFMHMGLAADLIAVQEGYDREQLEALGVQSHQRAWNATAQGYFKNSLIPVTDKEGKPLLERDQNIRENLKASSLAKLPAAFADFVEMAQPVVSSVYPDTKLEARHTAGTSPALVDGASLVLLASEQALKDYDLTPRAKITHFSNASAEPVRMLTGHIKATEKMLASTGLSVSDIDLWEINESFAASVLKYQQQLDIEDSALNVNGSALAMGHPLGATGGNLVSTLLDELERQNKKRGVVAICGGAGVGVCTLVERL